MVVSPGPAACATPAALMVATAIVDESHVTVLVMSRVELSE
jgi:hypothetical protein